MPHAVTADDLEIGFHEASASAIKAKSDVAKNVTIFTVTADLWNTARKLRSLVGLYKGVDFCALPGLTCQHAERSLAHLVLTIEKTLTLCRNRGLHNRALTGGAIESISLRLEDLKDILVMLSSATDSDLADAIKSAKEEESVDWESAWH